MADVPESVHVIVVRHAKAEGHASRDSERRLTERGVADAASAGRVVAAALGSDRPPGSVVADCSTYLLLAL